MVVTRGGAPGSHATNHVEEEFSTAFVLVPIPLQRTKEEIAKDNVKNHADVAPTVAKVKSFRRRRAKTSLHCVSPVFFTEVPTVFIKQ